MDNKHTGVNIPERPPLEYSSPEPKRGAANLIVAIIGGSAVSAIVFLATLFVVVRLTEGSSDLVGAAEFVGCLAVGAAAGYSSFSATRRR